MHIDIHHHLVYGVDDGAQTLEASLAMLRRAVMEQSVGVICCTSHDAPGDRPLNKALYREHLEMLRTAAEQEGLEAALLSGSEVLCTPEALGEMARGNVLTIGGTDALLVEFFPDMPWPLMKQSIRSIMGDYRMILAHAERYACLTQTERLAELHGMGVTIQMNANTVLDIGLLRGRWAQKAIRSGLVDIVASDAHGPEYRRCRLGDAYRRLASLFGEATANRLCGEYPRMLVYDR